jgi:hypothetical protein
MKLELNTNINYSGIKVLKITEQLTNQNRKTVNDDLVLDNIKLITII